MPRMASTKNSLPCADLIILRGPGWGWLKGLYSGGSTRWIESRAACSVVVLREGNYGACGCTPAFDSHPANDPPA